MNPERDQGARDAFLGLFFDADRRDWEGVAQALADVVFLDYSSSKGAEPRPLTRAAVVRTWLGFAPGFDSTHHHITVVRSTDIEDGLRIEANGIATHVLRLDDVDPLWTVAGYYDARLRTTAAKWVVYSLAFHRQWSSGNDQLHAVAVKRAVGAGRAG